MNIKTLFLIFSIFSFLVITVLFFIKNKTIERETKELIKTESSLKREKKKFDQTIKIIAKNLRIPWEIVFLPDNKILITERPGTVKLLKSEGGVEAYQVKEVFHYGEGGLLGAAAHPNFEKNRLIYLYLTYKRKGKILNKVVRYRLEKEGLKKDRVIIEGIKGAIFHNGGRIKFGPDGYLYITTGDATRPELSQDPKNLNGKILRIKDDGSIPEDNPFGNPVYSFGHRNPQGLAWDNKGQLWITEHGPSGAQSGFDEINKIIKGKNYGWPKILGDQENPEMIKPIVHSGKDETWAPAGAVFYKEYMFFAGLRGSSLYRFDPKTKRIKRYFKDKFGRLRAVVLGPDNFLYISTSNTDGRGKKSKDDDLLIKIDPQILK